MEMVIFHKLASLFDYPGPDYHKRVNQVEDYILQSYTSHFLAFEKYAKTLRSLDLGHLQEKYISSFDVKASSSLDVGHVLFGEDKKRNGFLIHLVEEHSKIGHDCGSEMADYLPNLLNLISISEDSKFNEEISVSIILPALRLMKAGIGSKENPYSNLFELLIEVIETKFTKSIFTEYIPVAKTSCNFSKSHCHHG